MIEKNRHEKVDTRSMSVIYTTNFPKEEHK